MNRCPLIPDWLRVGGCFILTAISGLLPAANAQTSEIPDSSRVALENRLFELELATVTGEDSGTSKQDALRNVRTIASEQIVTMGAHSLRDLLRSQLNFEVAQDPILGAATKMNGLGGRSVNVLIDGVPLTGRMNDNVDLSQVALNDVERIEIIDGPMAVEFGTNSLAGTINIITKTDLAARTTFEGNVQYESVGVQSQSVALSTNHKGRHHSLNLSRYYFDGWSPKDRNWDGFSDYLADSARTQLWNPKLQHTINWKTQYQIGKWLIKPRFNGMIEQIENKGAPRQPYGQTAFDDQYTTRRWIPVLEAKRYRTDGKSWSFLASYQRFWRSRKAFVTDLTNLEITPLEGTAQDTTSMHSFQTRGSGDILENGPWSIQVGWDLNHQTFTSRRMESPTKSISDAAMFAHTQWKRNQMKWKLGLRQAYNSQFASPLLPSVHGLWKSGAQRVRVSYAKGFRAPSLKELYFQFVDINHSLYGNENLEPETSHYGQLTWGVDRDLFAVSAELFTNFIQNQIGLIDQLDGTYRYQNFAQFQAQGFKVNGEIRGEKWTIGSAASVIGSQQKTNRNSDSFPRFTSVESATQIQWRANASFHLGASVRFIGPTQRVVSTEFESVQQQQTEGYSWVDAHVQWTSPSQRWQLTAIAKNLTNVTTVTNAANNAAHSPTNTLMSWGRSLNLRLNYRIESRNH